MADLNIIDFSAPGHHQNESVEVLDSHNHNQFDDLHINIEPEYSNEEKQNRKSDISDSTSTRSPSLTNDVLSQESNSHIPNTSQIKCEDTEVKVSYEPGNSLHEPIQETFKRDVIRIYNKIRFVIKIKKTEEEKNSQMQDWDLWGPFLLCIMLARYI